MVLFCQINYILYPFCQDLADKMDTNDVLEEGGLNNYLTGKSYNISQFPSLSILSFFSPSPTAKLQA
jgi:hypothetical protein